jgi:hypothetical protein
LDLLLDSVLRYSVPEMKTSILSALIAATLAVSTMAQDTPCRIEVGMTFADVAATWGLPVNQSVSDKGLSWYYSVPNESSATHRTFYTAIVVFDNNGRVSTFSETR